MDDLYTFGITVLMVFFAIMNPIGNTPIYIGLVEGYSDLLGPFLHSHRPLPIPRCRGCGGLRLHLPADLHGFHLLREDRGYAKARPDQGYVEADGPDTDHHRSADVDPGDKERIEKAAWIAELNCNQ